MALDAAMDSLHFLPGNRFPPYFLSFPPRLLELSLEIPLTKAEPANTGLLSAIYISHFCDLYIALLLFINHTFAIYKATLCDL